MRAPVVVFAVGNPSRGDDAIGPELCARLAAWLAEQQLSEQVELIEDFQLNIEHALDLPGRALALFIDAGENTPAPFLFQQIFPAALIGHSTHALPPAAVLQVFRQMYGPEVPPAFLLCVRGESFGLGEPLTRMTAERIESAFALLKALLRQPQAALWLERVPPVTC